MTSGVSEMKTGITSLPLEFIFLFLSLALVLLMHSVEALISFSFLKPEIN